MRVDQSNFMELTQKNNTVETKGNVVVSTQHTTTKKVDQSSGLTVSVQQSTYEKPAGKTAAEEIAGEMGDSKSDLSRHNEMAVLSNTMSPEDYEELQRNGFSSDETEGHTIVTVVDKIKLELAKSGVDISGMGGSLSADVVEQYTGNTTLTTQIMESLKNADLPFTTENVTDEKKACDLAMTLNSPSDGAIKYLVDNNLSPDISNLYKAENVAASGFTTASMDEADRQELEDQMKEVIIQAGLAVNEKTLNESSFMIANEIPLTAKNLSYVDALKGLELPLSETQVINAMTTAIAEGKRPENAMLLAGSSTVDQAADALNVVNQATEEDLDFLVTNGMEITIENLKLAENADKTKQSIDAENATTPARKTTESETTGQDTAENQTQTTHELAMVTARRQLEETRLVMTTQANYALLKQGVSIDTKPLEQLVEDLKNVENQYYEKLLSGAGAQVTDENVSVFKETMNTVSGLAYTPAYALGIDEADADTLKGLYLEGAALQTAMDKAGESYETMRTEVRGDLGDSIQKAFRNVDTILEDLELPQTKANERAVRILGYNNLDITEESIAQMKAADEEVQRVFKNLTPSVVTQMIKENENPLDMDFETINKKAEEIKQSNTDADEARFSEYLWKLEQNNNITEDERESYVGIYRLMNQVEKTDGAAIGALINQGADLTMRNLLTEVRNEKKSGMDYKVDDDFDGVDAAGSESITDQIDKGFQMNMVHDIMDTLSPENLKTAMENTEWENATPEEFYEELQKTDTSKEKAAYITEQLEQLGTAKDASGDVYEMLDNFDIPNTVSNVMAAKELLADRNQAYRRLFGMENDAYTSGDGTVDFTAIKEDLLQGFGEAMKTPEDMAAAQEKLADVAENVMRTMLSAGEGLTSLDIKNLKLMNKQIALGTAMAKNESYNIPIMVEGEAGNMSLKIVHGEEQKGMVDILFSLPSLGTVAAELKSDGSKVTGFIAAENQTTKELLESHAKEYSDAVCAEENLSESDIHYVVSGNLEQTFGKAAIYGQPAGGAQMGNRDSVDKENTEDSRTENNHIEDRKQVQTKTLYHIAKSFLTMINGL